MMPTPTPAMPFRIDRDAVFSSFASAIRFAATVATPANRVRVRRSRPEDGYLFRTYPRGAWLVQTGSPVSWRDLKSPYRYTYPSSAEVCS